MKTFLIVSFYVFVLLTSACSKDKIPGVYRIDIQQGNDVTQDMVNKLKAGMSKSQVAYIMGTPLLIDTFHPNRWDYIYSFHPGNGQREQRRLTLFFTAEETLSHIEGDTRTVAREDLPESSRSDTNVVVPLNENKTGLFQGLLNSIGLGEDEQEIRPAETSETENSATSEESEETTEENEQ
ncbi:cell envelope protein SmpA [Methylophaga sp. 42_25_T18]|nr:cell envelope protein SmpA [Methylophaga sp. 42_25_T18]OUR89027.1 cell envelope protein SmpA [Methylophaga sp. 42_8_T64]